MKRGLRFYKMGGIRMHYRKQVEEFIPQTQQEQEEKRIILKYIDLFSDGILSRENEIAHMTASGLIFNQNCTKVLMVHHLIYQTWVWTGGHADGDEDLLKTAEREAVEETGIRNLKPVSSDMLSLDILTVQSHFKNGSYVTPHLHLSAAYAFIGKEEEEIRPLKKENSAVQWIPISKLYHYSREDQILPVYEKIIERVNFIRKKKTGSQ